MMTTIAFQKICGFLVIGVLCLLLFFNFRSCYSFFVLFYHCPDLTGDYYVSFSRKMSELFSADWRSRPCFCPETIPLSPIDCLSFENTLTGGPSFQMLFFTQCNRKIAASTKQKEERFWHSFLLLPRCVWGWQIWKLPKKWGKNPKNQTWNVIKAPK